MDLQQREGELSRATLRSQIASFSIEIRVRLLRETRRAIVYKRITILPNVSFSNNSLGYVLALCCFNIFSGGVVQKILYVFFLQTNGQQDIHMG